MKSGRRRPGCRDPSLCVYLRHLRPCVYLRHLRPCVYLRHLRPCGGVFSISADLVGARGYGLLRSTDANYPNLDDPARARPNPRRHSYTVAYTLSTTERNTGRLQFLPDFDGNQRSATFGKPSGGEITRQVQLGVRFDF